MQNCFRHPVNFKMYQFSRERLLGNCVEVTLNPQISLREISLSALCSWHLPTLRMTAAFSGSACLLSLDGFTPQSFSRDFQQFWMAGPLCSCLLDPCSPSQPLANRGACSADTQSKPSSSLGTNTGAPLNTELV